jgi:biotin synthase
MIATARIVMPRAMVRLSAGREELSRESQLLCFLAGANSIFYGDKLLTTGNPDVEADQRLLKDAGLTPLEPSETSVREQGHAHGAAHAAHHAH